MEIQKLTAIGVLTTTLLLGGNQFAGLLYASQNSPAVTLSGSTADDRFGASVANSGTRVVIGASGAGRAYVYDTASVTPSIPVAILSNPSATYDFGWAVGISDTRVVVGSYGGERVYVYDLASVTPTMPVTTLDNPSRTVGDHFGSAVAISGTRIAIGAPFDDTGATDSGIAYVYDLASPTPIVPVAELTNPTPAVHDLFGSALAISGTRVVVGAYQDDTGAPNAGSAYVFDLASATPTVPVMTLNNPSPAADDQFGFRVAISGARVVVKETAGGTNRAASVYVYDTASNAPSVPIATINNFNPGGSLAISGTRLVIGNIEAPNAGMTRVYELASPTPTQAVATLYNPEPTANVWFGESVGISGARVVVGAPNYSGGNGRAYVYEFAFGTPPSTNRTLYVSQTSPNPTPPYSTWETAAHTIQEAVDAASGGDTVLVNEGEYLLTSQVTIAKAILLQSVKGAGQTTLNGNSRDRCLWVSNTLAVVDGFTMFRGEGPDGAGIFLVGGTVQNCTIANCYPTSSRPGASVKMIGGVLSNSIVRYAFIESRLVHCSNGGLITDCQIVDGHMGTADGTGVYLVNSQLRNSIVARMRYQYSAGAYGAGVYAVTSTISGCTITNNTAGRAGGGAYLDGCVMDRCIIVGNVSGSAFGSPGIGGGVFATNSTIRNSLIAANGSANGADSTGDGVVPGSGGGVYLHGGSLLNCTLSENRAAAAGGVYVESGRVRNSVVYSNSASSNANWYNAGGALDHICSTPDPGGNGNIVEDPQFVDAAGGDYRLAPTSPCIDAGINEQWMFGAKDLDGNPRILNGAVDLGAWESTSNHAPPSSDRTLYVSRNSPNPTPPYTTRETAAHTIQEAIDAACDGATVLVVQGTYLLLDQITVNKAITVRGESGAGQTILDGQFRTRCLWLSNSLAVVDGFTITRGFGVLANEVVMIGGTLSNCIVQHPSSAHDSGRLVFCTSGGLVTDCHIGDNKAFAAQGAGVYLVGSELRNSTISGMVAAGPSYGTGAETGAGVYAVSSTISGCTISGSGAVRAGGGAYLERCEVDRCIISGNTAGFGFGPAGQGGGIFAVDSVIRNSLIAANGASNGADSTRDGVVPGFGGGVYLRGGSLLNCTVTRNGSTTGGGLYLEAGTVRNSIIYFNSARTNANWFNLGAGLFDYTCTTPDPGGVGNITEDPQFLDATGNYRLASTSPCVDAGLNEAWMSGARDVDGNARIQNEIVDLGAWERPAVPDVTWIAPTGGASFPAGSDIELSVRATDRDGSVRFVEFFANSTRLGQVISATEVFNFVWSNAPSGPFRLHAEAVDNDGRRGSSTPILIVVGTSEPMASLSNPSRVTNDLFGFSVAIAGTRMVVGAPLNDTEGHDAGRAYVYDPASGTPAAPLVTLTNPSPYSVDDSFGFSVAGFETLIAVGAPRGEFVTVYDLGSAVPAAPVAMLTKPNPSAFERFGHSVAISGTRVVVGVPNAEPPGPYWWAAGSVCVFDLASSTPTTPILTLTNPSPAYGDVFGYSVAASGTRIIVGAPYDDDSAPDGGNAYVYDLASSVPTVPVATLTNPTPAANALFGYSVAVSGTRVMVGARGAGNVYAYELVNTPPSAVVPVLVATLTSPSSGTNDVFGYSVAISGTRAVVGAYHHEIDEAGMPGGGSTYIYDLASATPAEPVTTLYNPMPAVDDRFGYSVAVSDTRILVGAPNDDTGATDTGSAYVYDLARSTNNTIVSHPLVQFGPLQINNGFIRSMIQGLTGQGTITVETSIDLIEWHPIQTNTIAGETFELVTPISPGRSHQFFRALVMY